MCTIHIHIYICKSQPNIYCVNYRTEQLPPSLCQNNPTDWQPSWAWPALRTSNWTVLALAWNRWTAATWGMTQDKDRNISVEYLISGLSIRLIFHSFTETIASPPLRPECQAGLSSATWPSTSRRPHSELKTITRKMIEKRWYGLRFTSLCSSY